MKDRAQLDEEIDALAAWIPTMLAETHEVDKMEAFAQVAKGIGDESGPEDAAHVRDRLQQILVENCMVPADEGPCA